MSSTNLAFSAEDDDVQQVVSASPSPVQVVGNSPVQAPVEAVSGSPVQETIPIDAAAIVDATTSLDDDAVVQNSEVLHLPSDIAGDVTGSERHSNDVALSAGDSHPAHLPHADMENQLLTAPDIDDFTDAEDLMESMNSSVSALISGRLHDLARRFSTRTEFFKTRIGEPVTPGSDKQSASVTSSLSHEHALPQKQHRLNSLIPVASQAGSDEYAATAEGLYVTVWRHHLKLPPLLHRAHIASKNPQSTLYLIWLAIVSSAFMYNAVACPLRAAFRRAYFYDAGLASNLCSSVSASASTTSYVNGNFTGLDFSLYTSSPSISNDNESAEVLTLSSLVDGFTVDYYSTTSAPDYNSSSNVSKFDLTNEIDVTTMSPDCDDDGGGGEQSPEYVEGYETDDNRMYWWLCDYICDLIYVIDIVLVKRRLKFIKDGMWQDQTKEAFYHYVHQDTFKLDVVALTPLDIFYLIPAVHYNTLLRFPRLLKINAFWEFFDRMDSVLRNPFIIRVMRTLIYMIYIIHIEACCYYALSASEGLRLNNFVFNGDGNAYVRCFYIAEMYATSIANTANPVTIPETLLQTACFLTGIFTLGLLVGQFRDIFSAATIAKTTYQQQMDSCVAYMRSLRVPERVQDKVRLWFTFNWQNQKTLDENKLLEFLPRKMRADMAISVHFETLSKVQLFQDTDKNLLLDLVVKLKPTLFLAGDYICKKGEIGTAMYIVKMGQVEVVGGPNNSVVFATLHEGSVFGEISLLALAGGNRRTADVRAKGFAQLFTLSKADFEEAMRDYPSAHDLFKKRAKKILAQNQKKSEQHKEKPKVEIEVEEIIRREDTPKLLKTVIKVVGSQSSLHDMLRMRHSYSSSHDGSVHRPSQHAVSAVVDVHKDAAAAASEMFDGENEVLVVEQTVTPIRELPRLPSARRIAFEPIDPEPPQIIPDSVRIESDVTVNQSHLPSDNMQFELKPLLNSLTNNDSPPASSEEPFVIRPPSSPAMTNNDVFVPMTTTLSSPFAPLSPDFPPQRRKLLPSLKRVNKVACSTPSRSPKTRHHSKNGSSKERRGKLSLPDNDLHSQ